MTASSSSHEYEFGGPIGTFSFIIISHCLIYYFWMAWEFNNGALFIPTMEILNKAIERATPGAFEILTYTIFLSMEAFFAIILPGPVVEGLPIPSENGKKLKYLCNGVAAWWLTLALAATLHITHIFRLSWLVDSFGALLTCSAIAGDVLALVLYVQAVTTGNAVRMTGNTVYDFFMGATLNPRIGTLDVKMWAEIRMSWILLFLLTSAAACKQIEQDGSLSDSMLFLLVAHFLYVNACQKGEECIPFTWDITAEKYGWMLSYWNLCGVPFLYSFQAMYLLKNRAEHDMSATTKTLYFAVLFAAYYVWDTAQSQKARFRMKMRGQPIVQRFAFPQLPWGTLSDAKFIRTKNGSTLLIDGWFRYARKIYYTADVVMAALWGLSCVNESGVGALAMFYPIFFAIMLLHRYGRDVERCRKKYGEDWDAYVAAVPYVFVPGVF